MTKRNRGSSLEQVRPLLRKAGLRATAPRLAVLRLMADAKAPLSHAELAEKLAPLGFDRVTLYRNLVDLADAGMFSRIDLGDHLWRFEFRGASKREKSEHPHFVCDDCGSVSCLPEVNVSLSLRPGAMRSAAMPDVSQVVLKGRCESH